MARLKYRTARTCGAWVKKVLARFLSLSVCIFLLIACENKQSDALSLSETEDDTSSLRIQSGQGKKAAPDYQITLPYDHLSHDAFDIEWWYLTANLQGDDGQDYAVQWTLFRFRQNTQNPLWDDGQIFMAHASVHTQALHIFEERFAPGALGTARVGLDEQTQAFRMELDNWQWQGQASDGSLLPARLSVPINTDNDQEIESLLLNLELQAQGPYILHGQAGYSVKSPEGKHASHYYSQPFIQVSGYIEVNNVQVSVSGSAWYDHEWTSTLLDETTQGWDWMSLHLDNGDKLMAFRMRLNNQKDYVTGTYIFADGAYETLLPHEISLDELHRRNDGERDLPLDWLVKIKKLNLELKVSAQKTQAYNRSIFPYYEGPVEISGSHSGKGFLELTGY
uniref:lipocalin-like domain-containing protein n=1 Tax=Ningiella ruwaisensis TaxID=2364274 RepID=UPI0010A0BBF1|nr:lipocalin-like domain-containing protein [Ningiella ruwaisensis]